MSISICILILYSCKEPVNWETRCIQDVEYSCTDVRTYAYFSGVVNGFDLCLSAEVDDYVHLAGYYNSYTTPADNPVFDQTNPPPIEEKGLAFQLFKIESGVNAPYTWTISITGPPVPVDSFVFKKELDELQDVYALPLRNDADRFGYDFHLAYSCNTDEVVGLGDPYLQSKNVVLVHNRVTQPVDAFIRVSAYSKEDLGNAWQYDISFEMQMRLYYMDEVWKKFGDLEQGVFKTRTIVPK